MNFWEYLVYRRETLFFLAIQHVEVVLLAVGIATVAALAIGALIHQNTVASQIALSITATMLTIPAFALFGLLIPLLGLGLVPTVAALTFYALFPILRNVITGLDSTPQQVEDAATGLGLTKTQRLLTVRIPLTLPVIINGIRLATIMSVSIAAIAAAVNGPGLGELIFQGLARIGGANALNSVLAGVLGVAVVALVLDLLFVALGRITTSRGIRD